MDRGPEFAELLRGHLGPEAPAWVGALAQGSTPAAEGPEPGLVMKGGLGVLAPLQTLEENIQANTAAYLGGMSEDQIRMFNESMLALLGTSHAQIGSLDQLAQQLQARPFEDHFPGFGADPGFNPQQLDTHYANIMHTLRQRHAEVSKLLKSLQERKATLVRRASKTYVASVLQTSRPGLLTQVPEGVAASWDTAQAQMEEELDAGLVQELEAENDALLEELHGELAGVQQAAQTLASISGMQTELETHLTSQAATIETLYDEAWQQTDTIRAANQTLLKAQKNKGDARTWVLVFLLGASFVLLFLDWYA